MPVTRSEAMFFAGGLVAGVAAVAAYPWLKRKYETLQDPANANGQSANDAIGRKLSETVEEFLKNAPDYVDAGKSGLRAGFEAACRMAQTVSNPGENTEKPAPVTEPSHAA